ncbi:MAG UNVERIFIED_CONTAM: hypothetical protein LVR18_28060 [Planctomycetaceae bacterium]|jgi:hypothetical protein
MATSDHLDYADEAESAERAEAWPQAMALWQRAIASCPVEQLAYAEGVARCQRQIDVDTQLASIARRAMDVPTLESRNSDGLDFHEVAVWEILKSPSPGISSRAIIPIATPATHVAHEATHRGLVSLTDR